MRARVLLHIVLVAMASSPAMGEKLYRCEQGGRVTYGDRMCAGGIETRVQPAAVPSIDEQKVAVARLRQELAEFDARWATRVATSSAAPGTSTGASPRSTAAAAGDRETYCFERHDGSEATPTLRVTRHVTLSSIVRN
jgi:hypothetical protein